MTFAAENAKKSGKRPIWLYEFTIGTSVWRVTRKAASIFGTPAHTTSAGQPDASFVGSTDWDPMVIEQGRLDQSAETTRQELDLMVPAQSALGIAIRDYATPTRIGVKIWQTFHGDPDEEYVQRFTGRVAQRKPGIVALRMVCENTASELKLTGNPPVIQRACPHVHYFTPSDPDEAGCRLDPTPFKVSGTASFNTGNLVVCNEALLQPSGTYTYGLLFWGSEEFFIVEHVGNQLRLDRRPVGMPGFASISIAPGCDGSMASCITFGNTLNHGGFPNMTETPWTGWSAT